MFGYDYYVKTDENNNVVDSFTTGFRKPETGDKKIASNQSERCWTLPAIDQITGEYRLSRIDMRIGSG